MHAREKEQQRDNADIRKWYGTQAWRTLRLLVLGEEPWCKECAKQGFTVASTDVDHVVPHRGVWALFWDRSNLQGLCHACHSQKTRRGQ